MNSKFRILREHIKGVLQEDWNPKRQIVLSSDVPTEFGSAAHLSDLKILLDRMIKLRDAQKRSTASRYVYANAISRIRKQIKKIEKQNDKKNNVSFK